MSDTIEKRLETARKARDARLADGDLPTVADRLLDALDSLPEADWGRTIGTWAGSRAPGTLAYLRKGVAQSWIMGPKK